MSRAIHSPVPGTGEWPAYVDPLRRFKLRYPPEWKAHIEGPDQITVREPEGWAECSIQYAETDCSSRQVILRGRRLNYFLVREFMSPIAGHEATTFEFRDTVANRRDFRAVLPAERGCYELAWRYSERTEGQACQSTLAAILLTVEINLGPPMTVPETAPQT